MTDEAKPGEELDELDTDIADLEAPVELQNNVAGGKAAVPHVLNATT